MFAPSKYGVDAKILGPRDIRTWSLALGGSRSVSSYDLDEVSSESRMISRFSDFVTFCEESKYEVEVGLGSTPPSRG